MSCSFSVGDGVVVYRRLHWNTDSRQSWLPGASSKLVVFGSTIYHSVLGECILSACVYRTLCIIIPGAYRDYLWDSVYIYMHAIIIAMKCLSQFVACLSKRSKKPQCKYCTVKPGTSNNKSPQCNMPYICTARKLGKKLEWSLLYIVPTTHFFVVSK